MVLDSANADKAHQNISGEHSTNLRIGINISLLPEDDGDDYSMPDEARTLYQSENKTRLAGNVARGQDKPVSFNGQGGAFVQQVPKSAVQAYVNSAYGPPPKGSGHHPIDPLLDPLNRATFKFCCESDSSNMSAFRETLEAQPTQKSSGCTGINGKLLKQPGHPNRNFATAPLIGNKRKLDSDHKADHRDFSRPGSYTTEWQCDTGIRKRRPLYKTADGYLLSTSIIPTDPNAQTLDRFPKTYALGTSMIRRSARFVKNTATRTTQSWLSGWFGTPKPIPRSFSTKTPVDFRDYHSTHIVANSCYAYDRDEEMTGM